MLPLHLVVVGAPGKGTLCEKILHSFPAFNHVSSGNLLRQRSSPGPPRPAGVAQSSGDKGEQIASRLRAGHLVADATIKAIVLEHLVALGRQSWVLDGFPRNVAQARVLDEWGSRDLRGGGVHHVVNLQVPESVVLERVLDRWIHLPSGRVYNTRYSPPAAPGIDDVTGEPLVQRSDDSPSVIKERLRLYKQETEPVLQYYGGRVQTFTGTDSGQIWDQLRPWISSHLESN